MINQPHSNKIIVVIGATATNKTEVGITLAQAFCGEIINADAFQVYRELNLGVNKPTTAQLKTAKFHLISHISIKDTWDIKRFQQEANTVIQTIYARHKIPIIVGGSHLYIDALIKNYDLDTNQARDERFVNLTNQELQLKLRAYNEKLATNIGNNHKRLVRALQNLTDHNPMHQTKTPNYTPCYIWCTKPREQLYQDIDNRVDHMIKNGWFEEVNHIIQHTPAYQHLNAFKAIGYLSIARGLLNPQIEIDVNKIKQQTRQYAKRQITWIRHHYPDVYVYDQNNISGVLKHIKTWLDR